MRTNFAFISTEFPGIYKEAVEAEKYVNTAPRYSAILSRTTIEKTILWLYENDATLSLPYDTSLSALMHNYEFKELIPESMFVELNIVRRVGNKAAHGDRVNQYEALQSLKFGFRFLSWLSRYYSVHNPDIPTFDESLILKGDEQDKSKKELEKLQNKLEIQRKEYDRQLRRQMQAEVENAELRKQIEERDKRLEERKKQREEQYRNTVVVPPLTSEHETRKQLIDLLLFEAGWKHLRDGVDTEYEVSGMPRTTNPSGIGYVDYVLWGDDGKPLAVVEAKSTLHDPSKGKHQASLYADCLEKESGQRPVIFYSNGYQTYIWDDAFYPPRRVSGFYSKSELQTLIRRRGEMDDLRNFPVNVDISGRPYQLQAIKAVAENFTGEQNGKIVGRHRKALLVMATGSGKTRTAVSVVDMLTRCNWAKRVLFLADRNALVRQAKNSFKELLPQLSAINLVQEKNDNTARLVFSTYPTMMNMIDDTMKGGEKKFGIAHFDLIIIDEAHRSVYQKYQAIFDYFDSLLLGLTATPVKYVDRNTYELFEIEDDNPTFAYELEQAVADRYLVPPKALDIPLKFPRSGVKYSELSEKDKRQFEELYGIDSVQDEGEKNLVIPSSKVNKFLFNNDTVDKVLDLLFEYGLKVESGNKIGKTIIFAKNHRHAVFIAERFYKNYPEYGGDFLEVIDNYNDKAEDLIDKFTYDKGDEKNPQIAVSVDMLDTGIDAPRVLNLIFFKEVKSYAKYWQMIGRGTRLCPNIFGQGDAPENHKKFFLIFDICGNAAYFENEQQKYEGISGKSLNQLLFEAQLEVVYHINSNANSTDEERQFALDYTEELYHKIKALDENRFVVRKHWEQVKKYKQREEWDDITVNKKSEMNQYLSKLISYEEDTDEMAKRFDLLIYRLEFTLLTSDKRQTRFMGEVSKIGERLRAKLNIPSVKQREETLISLSKSDFWDGISMMRLEKLRRELRDIIQYLKGEKEEPVYSDFKDELDYSDIKEVDIVNVATDYENYRARVENFIRRNSNHIVIDKIYKNIPITPAELEELELFLTHEKFDVSEIEREFETKSLAVFVRKVLGMDITAANEHFAQFIREENLNHNQIEFINLIIKYLNRNGVLDKRLLTQAPFNSMSDNGIFGIFEEAGKAHKVIQLIDELERGVG